MPETKEISFKYPIGTEVFFMHNSLAYSGKIIGRAYTENLVSQEWGDPMVQLETVYTVVNPNASKDFTFKENDFDYKVFTDKVVFNDKKIIIS